MSRLAPLTLCLLLLVATLGSHAQAASAEVAGTVPAYTVPPAKIAETGLVGASSVYDGEKVYILGGRYHNGQYANKIIQYDPTTKVASNVTDMPRAAGATSDGRYSGAAALVNGKIYYFGGATLVSTSLRPGDPPVNVPRSTNEILEFDPKAPLGPLNPRVLTDRLPLASWGHMAAVHSTARGPVVYLFGGFYFDIADSGNIHRLDTIVRFNAYLPEGGTLQEARVEKLSTRLPYALQDGALGTVSGRTYLLGGLGDHHATANPCPVARTYEDETGEWRNISQTVCSTDNILAFNPVTESVSAVGAKLPYRGQFMSGGVVNNKVYVPGARLIDGNAASSILEFNPGAAPSVNPVRVLVPTLPKGTFGASTTSDGNKLYMIGGRGPGPTEAFRTITVIDPGVTPPWAPRALQAATSGASVKLTWEPPSYDGDAPVTGYRVYRTEMGGTEAFLGSATGLSFDDATARPSTTYGYRVTSVNAKGETPGGARVALVAGAVPPSIVRELQAFPGNGEMLLRWQGPADAGGSNLTGFRVFVNGTERAVATPPPGATEARITGLVNDVAYTFFVAATNSKGEGPRASVTATPIPVPGAPSGVFAYEDAGTVRISWSAPATTVRAFIVYRGTDPARLTPLANTTTTTFEEPTPPRGRTYYYAISATNDVGASPPSDIAAIALVEKPSPPAALLAAGVEGEVRLTWQAPTSPGVTDPSLVTYIVSRDGRAIASDVRGASYTDRAVLPGRAYTYTVTAFNGLQSDPSPQATATPKAVVNKPPVATLAVLQSVAIAGERIQMDASQSFDEDGRIATYTFDFGDGTEPVSTTNATVTHAYRANGTYTVTLRVVDNRGDTSEAAQASLLVGEPDITKPDDEVPRDADKPPGTSRPKIPGPGAWGVLVALGLAGALARRHRRG